MQCCVVRPHSLNHACCHGPYKTNLGTCCLLCHTLLTAWLCRHRWLSLGFHGHMLC